MFGKFLSLKIKEQSTRTFQGTRKKVRVIGISSYRDPEENSRE